MYNLIVSFRLDISIATFHLWEFRLCSVKLLRGNETHLRRQSTNIGSSSHMSILNMICQVKFVTKTPLIDKSDFENVSLCYVLLTCDLAMLFSSQNFLGNMTLVRFHLFLDTLNVFSQTLKHWFWIVIMKNLTWLYPLSVISLKN